MKALFETPRNKVAIIVLSFLILTSVVIGVVYYSSNKADSPEKIAIQFYRATWVDGNKKEAKRYLVNPNDPQLSEELQNYGSNPKVLIVANPQDPQTDMYKSYFIHRPTDEHGFRVYLTNTNGVWKVSKFSHQDTNGYAAANYYLPSLKDQWKEVQP